MTDPHTFGADRFRRRRGEGPGLVSRLPGMAYQCRNDPGWTMEFVSEGCRALTGYDPEEMIGSRGANYADVIHPDDRARVWEAVQRSLAEGEPSFELQYRIVTASGEIRQVWEQGHPVRSDDGELVGLEGFVTDVTELQRTRRRLETSEEMIRSLVDQALVGVYVIQEGVFRYVNPALAEIFGYTVEELQYNLGPLDLTAEEDRERVGSQIRKRLDREEDSLRYEFTGLRKDGSTIRAEAHGSLVEIGGERGIAGVLIDVTERRALEERLRHAQRVEGLGELTGAIAHDFNNYLTAIIAPIELVLQDLEEEDPRRSELQQARETAQQAGSLTRELLSFGRKRIHSPRPLSLNEALERLGTMLRRLTGERVELVLDLDPKIPSVVADPSYLQQIVVNLVVNARDAMPSGGRVVVETRTETVEGPRVRPWNDLEPGTYAVLVVRDEGVGMDEETLEHLFDPYFTTKERGTGLGLSTVFGIVKQHGGGIDVESAPGVGTEFRVFLPGTEEAPAGDEKPEEDGGRAGVRRAGEATILVVEDEPAVRRVTVAALRRFGYTVLDAGDGESALALEGTHGESIDLLLTDLGLPDTTGIELADAMRERRPEILVLLTSGYAGEELLRDPREGPDFPFLEKPFVIDDLLRSVDGVLRGARGLREEAVG